LAEAKKGGGEALETEKRKAKEREDSLKRALAEMTVERDKLRDRLNELGEWCVVFRVEGFWNFFGGCRGLR
jgi:predicted  nucleic acid-binding Zn-ribbon protein